MEIPVHSITFSQLTFPDKFQQPIHTMDKYFFLRYNSSYCNIYHPTVWFSALSQHITTPPVIGRGNMKSAWLVTSYMSKGQMNIICRVTGQTWWYNYHVIFTFADVCGVCLTGQQTFILSVYRKKRSDLTFWKRLSQGCTIIHSHVQTCHYSSL